MPRPLPEEELEAIVEAVRRYRDGAAAGDIAAVLPPDLPRRTLQYRLKNLVDAGRLRKEGEGRWAKYYLPEAPARGELTGEGRLEATGIARSKGGDEVRAYLKKPPEARKPVGYDRGFLESYRPNESFYLSAKDRAHLAETGHSEFTVGPAGTYAKQILGRLLIDLSWNSSRLEGNTYSLLDTKRLIEFGEEVEGRDRTEAQMILNHKDAIEFLVGAAEEIGFNRYTVLNLQAILANNLLADETAAGRLRHIAVGIEGSAFHPLEGPQRIEACFDQILATAAAIEDPFEQSFFVMVQLPYLQPFDDVNKRVSRLASNIPFIRSNLTPLSFTDVPRDLYTEAVLGVYELNKVDLLRDVYIWSYERSAARYAAVLQSLGEPDPFRLRHRQALGGLVGAVVRERMGRKQAASYIASWIRENVSVEDREPFREMAENEVLGLHEGNFARYRITPAEFAAWREVWSATGS